MTTKLYTLPLFLLLTCFFVVGCKKTAPPEPAAQVVSIDPSFLNVAKSLAYSYQLKATVANGSGSNQITWSSENPRIATVTASGLVMCIAAGETNIVATLSGGTAVAKCKVTVSDGDDYKYRLVLKDKGTSAYSISSPGEFLSARAIERRRKRNIPIDQSDLPISPDYIKAIQNVGGIIVAKSKWLNTVSINTSDELSIDKYKTLPFVKDVILVWEGKRSTGSLTKYVDAPQAGNNQTANGPLDYGTALNNISVSNGQALHDKGFRGAGIEIADIDAGFINLKTNPAFNNINIKGAKSFVYEQPDPYSTDDHGVWVTSCMAVNKPGFYVGTAPEASYWLLHTEDQTSEYPIEEDYWANAIEYADSAGVDIVNSSLSYTTGYYLPSARYKFEDMDGKTALASRAANMAFSKGIFIVCSAGNEQQWVGTPADSPNVLTVGSINKTFNIDSFSSWGITVDGRVKPDIVALGGGASVINNTGVQEPRSGTSYASPIICGLAACLWQAYPKLNNKELMDVIRKSADRYNNPIMPYGYGIANMQKAMDLAKVVSDSK
ncbi:Ig-like domain (group 2) [Mucilaginibacter pineti]|uniref:Ig-like domain (Group 2) n=1 Tax=Mucilaginibacter pineti TaxID=1391627 RepID=A0A1G7FVT0_9SPHI|nr:S8 family serine peptidase [Mucilaginibacter pineti]SDE80033.1 Ig-like domain (group 2) [Mucilaginibacter pineti]